MKVDLVALSDRMKRKYGERFSAPRNQARVLKALGEAADAPVEQTYRTRIQVGETVTPTSRPKAPTKAPRRRAAKATAAKPMTTADAKATTKGRTYKTRRLKAED